MGSTHSPYRPLLANGQVLVAGGEDANETLLQSAELFDPSAGTFTATEAMTTPRVAHTANLLPNGLVLLIGGVDADGNGLASAELFDPSSGSFTATGSLNDARGNHTATTLANGQILVAGGADADTVLDSAELYQP